MIYLEKEIIVWFRFLPWLDREELPRCDEISRSPEDPEPSLRWKFHHQNTSAEPPGGLNELSDETSEELSL